MVGAKTPPGDPPAGPQRIRGPSNMSSGGPKLKSSHPCRNSAVDGLPSTTRAAAQTWSTTRETRIGDTRDRFETLSDTPRVPQPRRSSSGPGADRHDHSERSTRTAGAATRARAMMDIKTRPRSGNPIAPLYLRDSLREAEFFGHQDRHIVPQMKRQHQQYDTNPQSVVNDNTLYPHLWLMSFPSTWPFVSPTSLS